MVINCVKNISDLTVLKSKDYKCVHIRFPKGRGKKCTMYVRRLFFLKHCNEDQTLH